MRPPHLAALIIELVSGPLRLAVRPEERAISTPPILVFVVEDEVLIQDMIVHDLEDAGFAVVTAASGEEAIDIVSANKPRVRALVTDVNLARNGATGWDVAARAREVDPTLPIIYMTGAAAHDWAEKGVPNSKLFTKPISMSQVVAAIRTLLSANRSS